MSEKTGGKTILAVVSDLHIGSTTALCPPKFEVHGNRQDETQIAEYNLAQAWIYKCWLDYWQFVDSLLEYRKNKRTNRLIVAILGDVVDGIHHNTVQVMPELADQAAAAMALLQPIIDKAYASLGIIGTEAHAGNAGDTEWALYRALGVTHTGYHLMASIDGLVHDFAHQGRGGGRPWTSGGAGIAAEVLLDCAMTGAPAPRYIWRGHTHVISDSGEQLAGTRAIGCPSWQLKTAFAHRMPNWVRSDIGGMVCYSGALDWSRARYEGQPDRRSVLCL